MRAWEREIRTVGVASKQVAVHNRDCRCESCGPLILVGFSQYEAHRLRDALMDNTRALNTGDWYLQVLGKLDDVLKGDRWPSS